MPVLYSTGAFLRKIMEDIVYEVIDAILKVVNSASDWVLTYLVDNMNVDVSLAPTLDTFFLLFGKYAHKIINFSIDVAWFIFFVGLALNICSIIFWGVNPDMRQGLVQTIIRVILAAGMITFIIRPTVTNGSEVSDEGILGIFMSAGEDVYELVERNFGYKMTDSTYKTFYTGETYDGGEYTSTETIEDKFGTINPNQLEELQQEQEELEQWQEDQRTEAIANAYSYNNNTPQYSNINTPQWTGQTEQQKAEAEAKAKEKQENQEEAEKVQRRLNHLDNEIAEAQKYLIGTKVISIILIIVELLNIIKLLTEMYKRYVNVCGLYVLAPPMAALMVGQTTSTVTFKYIQMFGAEIAMLCFTRFWLSTVNYVFYLLHGVAGGWIFLIAWTLFGLKIDGVLNRLGLGTASTGPALLDSIAANAFVATRLLKGAAGAPMKAAKAGFGLAKTGVHGAGHLASGLGLATGSDKLLSAGQAMLHKPFTPEAIGKARNDSMILDGALQGDKLTDSQMATMDKNLASGSRLGSDEFNKAFNGLTPEQKEQYLAHRLEGSENPMEKLSDSSIANSIDWDLRSLGADGSFSGSILDSEGHSVGTITASRNEDGSYSYSSEFDGEHNLEVGKPMQVSEESMQRASEGYYQDEEIASGIKLNSLAGYYETADQKGNVATFTGVGDGCTQVNGNFAVKDTDGNVYRDKEGNPYVQSRAQFVQTSNGQRYEIGQMHYDKQVKVSAEQAVKNAFTASGYTDVHVAYDNNRKMFVTSFRDSKGDKYKVHSVTPEGRAIKDNETWTKCGVAGHLKHGKPVRITTEKNNGTKNK